MSLFFVEKDAAPTPISCWILRLFASRFQPLALSVPLVSQTATNGFSKWEERYWPQK